MSMKFFYLAKLLLKKPAATRQVVRWTPILIRHNLDDNTLKGYLFSILGYPNYSKMHSQYMRQMKYNTFYNIPSMAPLSGLSGLCKTTKTKNENSMLPTDGKQGDFKNIKNVQFVHAVNLVQNPMAMDDFSLNDVDTVVSDMDYQDSFESINSMEESVVLSWTSSNVSSDNSPYHSPSIFTPPSGSH